MGMGLCLAARIRHIEKPIELEQSVGKPVELRHIVIAIAGHMDLLRVHPRHHVGRIVAGATVSILPFLDLLEKLPVMTVQHIGAVAMPLGLIDLLLVMAGPHIVAVVHLLLRQRNLALDVPPSCRHDRHRAREPLFLPRRQFISGIDPDFANPLPFRPLLLLDHFTIKGALERGIEISHVHLCRATPKHDRDRRIGRLVLLANLGVILPIGRGRHDKERAEYPQPQIGRRIAGRITRTSISVESRRNRPNPQESE